MKDIIKNDYIITKDNDFLGQRYETYTVEKTVSLRNKPELKQYEVSFVY